MSFEARDFEGHLLNIDMSMAELGVRNISFTKPTKGKRAKEKSQ